MWRSCAKTILSDREVEFSFLDLENFLGPLVSGESSANGSGELGSEEDSSFARFLVQGTGEGSSFLLVEDS